jgi:cytochrome c peroxidase
MDFYNKGGGEGLGYKVGNQTLAADKLNLTQTEIGQVIAFIKSLDSK